MKIDKIDDICGINKEDGEIWMIANNYEELKAKAKVWDDLEELAELTPFVEDGDMSLMEFIKSELKSIKGEGE